MEEPEELRNEPQRWTRVKCCTLCQWSNDADERLIALVVRSTPSGDRFPVGVNWMEVSNQLRHSPVECMKRYALLHFQRQGDRGGRPDLVLSSTDSTADKLEELLPSEGESDEPFSGLSSVDDELQSPAHRSFLDYCSPVASPKIGMLDHQDDFADLPGSPPPFAVRQRGPSLVSSPFRWEQSQQEAPVLKAPPHVLRRAPIDTLFGVEEDVKTTTTEGVASPRIVHGTQDHPRMIGDPGYAASIINHAFKGMHLDSPPPRGSPRLIRTVSNDYPFLKEEDVNTTRRTGGEDAPSTPPFMQASGLSNLSSFHGDNPFMGSITQSALEDAFLDMAGSRLDASSVFLGRSFAPPPPPRSGTEEKPPSSER